MFSYHMMRPSDIFSLDISNLDAMSENFTLDYYLEHLLQNPQVFMITEKRSGWFPSMNFSGSYMNEDSEIYGKSQKDTEMIYTKKIVGYIFGRKEIKPINRIYTSKVCCLHLCGLSISPSARQLGIGTRLHNLFELNGVGINAFFYDLYVRVSNMAAINLYKKLGYCLYRRIHNYYFYPYEDAWDMRKASVSDMEKKSVEPYYNM